VQTVYEMIDNKKIHKDDFDVALIPGKRDELKHVYGQFRLEERSAQRDIEGAQSNTDVVFEDIDNCPLCGATSNESDNIYHIHGMEIVSCCSCSFIYSRQVFDRNYDQSHYANKRISDMQVLLKNHPIYANLDSTKCRYALQSISAHSSPPGTLLDVGSATGTLLFEGRNAGWEVFGVEVSVPQANIAIRKGLRVLHGYFPNVCSSFQQESFPQTFDVITLFDVLEHILKPKAFITEIRRRLNPGGILAIQVPNIDSLIIRLEGRDSSNFCVGHWMHFSHRTLRRMLEDSGFECLTMETYISELDRINSFSDATLTAMSGEISETQDSLKLPISAQNLHNAMMGYKLFGVFRN
jgi:2-polyprenyl-3-methyl-5-hydroxy-6-metoxy-1,4-benzoquinol methylase